MKKILFFTLLIFSNLIYAVDVEMMEKIKSIQAQWAIIKYQMVEDRKADAYENLTIQAKQLAGQYPENAEPLIWQAINLSSYAGAIGGLKSLTRALPAVKQARELLHDAERIDPQSLDGSIYTTLGALYYQVPGWPIAFGDKNQARFYLEKAMSNNPNKLDAGFFYGDFLIQQHEYGKARQVLEDALASPTLLNRPLADKGRRMEIRALLEHKKLKQNS